MSARKKEVLLRFDGPVANLTISDPQALNAIGPEIAAQLSLLILEVECRLDVHVLVIKGAGKAFCVGGDIQSFDKKLGDLEIFIRSLLRDLHLFLGALRRMPQLVLTSVHGAAAGAGLSLAFMGDLCIAAENARFIPAYRRLGISPDGGGTVGVVRAVGPRRALQMFLAEDSISARQAEAWGLVNWVVPDEELDEACGELAERLAKIPLETIAATKRLIHQSSTRCIEGQLEAEKEELLNCMRSPFFRASVEDFLVASGGRARR